MPIDTYQITIEDTVKASSYAEALSMTLERIKTEETDAHVERMSTGQVKHFEIQSGECLDSDRAEVSNDVQ